MGCAVHGRSCTNIKFSAYLTQVNKGSYFYFNIFGEEKRQLQTIGSPIFECGNIHSAQIVEDTYTANENKNPVESIIPTIQTKPANPGNREKPAFRQLRLMIVDDNIFNIMTLEVAHPSFLSPDWLGGSHASLCPSLPSASPPPKKKKQNK